MRIRSVIIEQIKVPYVDYSTEDDMVRLAKSIAGHDYEVCRTINDRFLVFTFYCPDHAALFRLSCP